jgi:alkanesulfonate monooxygenase SsuD/methylene tetrahydromethanopterin reductase-like flavin-dependent oxidoreductase (luciferase family)
VDRQAAILLEQASLAEQAGFDGVTLSEHHAGFPSYMPQPLLACAQILANTRTIWSGPTPLISTLWNPAFLAEQLAWTAAYFPGRVAAAFAPGYAEKDFVATGMPFEDRGPGFGRGLSALLEALSLKGLLHEDAAIRRWAEDPPPLLSTGTTATAARRAADLGLGLFVPGSKGPERLAPLVRTYRECGGSAPVLWARSVWVGEPPVGGHDEIDSIYQQAAPKEMGALGIGQQLITGSPERIAEGLVEGFREVGATALNIRFNAAHADPDMIGEQIVLFGKEVIPLLRASRDSVFERGPQAGMD